MLRAHVVHAGRSWEVRVLRSAWATITLQADAIEFAVRSDRLRQLSGDGRVPEEPERVEHNEPAASSAKTRPSAGQPLSGSSCGLDLRAMMLS